MANQQRRRRIEEQVQRELSEILRLELRDPRVGMVTISGVELSPDLSYAKVFYTVLGSENQRKSCEKALAHARGFLRSALGQRLSLRVTPELRFAFDNSIENGARLSQLIDSALGVSGTKSE